MAVIELREVSMRYGKEYALKDISFRVNSGEILAILGPSGSGKTSILRLIAGLESPCNGTIHINNTLVASNGDISVPAERRRVGMVFQDYALFPHLSVRDNISFGLRGVSKSLRHEIISRLITSIRLKGLEERYPHQLSGGQQQRVALARALATSPVVMLLDEPFSGLDEETRLSTREETLRILREMGTTTIIVTHSKEEAFSIANRVMVLNNGHMEQIDSPDNIYHLPATKFVAEFVGEADFIDGVVKDNRIYTEIGTFSGKTDLPDGTEVQVMIRPEDISIFPDKSGEAVVERRIFKGSENLYVLQLPSGRRIHSSTSSVFAIHPGSKVRIKSFPSHLVVFQGGQRISI